jgi:hypothetical protein
VVTPTPPVVRPPRHTRRNHREDGDDGIEVSRSGRGHGDD